MKIFRTFKALSLISIISMGAMAALLSLSSCGEPKFKVEGEIAGADNQLLLLEKSDFQGRWIVVDSVRTKKNGSYSISSEAPASPEIYRLSLDDKFVYFPVDSVENLKVNSSAKAFGSDFTVEGTDQAVAMASFEKELQKLNINDTTAVKKFKRDVFSKYLQESRGSIVSYYVLTKVVGDKQLYDPADDDDVKYYAAVATSFDQFRPGDPHAGMLKSVSLQAMRRKNAAAGRRRVIEANEVTIIDVDLQNEAGKNVKLSDVVKQGKPTVLIFALMNDQQSPALNRALSEIYNSKGGNVNFYHVSVDGDHYAWREAARNLPWTTVIDPAGQTSDALRKYNVGALPTFFIYNSAGVLSERAESLSDLRKKL